MISHADPIARDAGPDVVTDFAEMRPDRSMRYKMVSLLLAEMLPHQAEHILDVACHDGCGTAYLADMIGCCCTGLSDSPAMLDHAQKYFDRSNTFFVRKSFPYDVPHQAYDAIVCFDALEMSEQPTDLFARLAYALKPGGLLFVSTYNEKVVPLAANKDFFANHIRHFSTGELLAFGKTYKLDPVIRCGQNMLDMDGDKALRVNPDLPMNFDAEDEVPHLFVHIYQKPADAAATNVQPSVKALENSGTDAYPKGILRPALLATESLKIDVGCGELGPPPGFIGADIRPVHPRIAILSDTWSLRDFLPDNCVAEFFSRHTLEHVTFTQLDMTLTSWLRLLKPGGRVRIMVPDMEYHIHQFLHPEPDAPAEINNVIQYGWTQRQHAVAGFWGWQREADTKVWDVHKNGHTYEMFKATLERLGFKNVSRLKNDPWHLDLEGFKPLDQ